MAGSLSDALEIKLLDHVFKNTAFTVPTNIYIALSTADPLDTGASIAEPVGSGYARTVMDSWDTAASRATENTSVITFPTATGAWGTITHYAIFDAVTAGNFLAHGDLTASRSILSGNTLSFAAGDIDVSITTGGYSDYLANKLLDHIFKTTSFSQPTNIVAAASATTIVDGDTGSTITEPASSYARVTMNNWDAAASGATQNTDAITFPEASGSWGTISDTCVLDNSVAGNMLRYTTLDSSQAIVSGDTLEWAIGAWDVTLT